MPFRDKKKNGKQRIDLNMRGNDKKYKYTK